MTYLLHQGEYFLKTYMKEIRKYVTSSRAKCSVQCTVYSVQSLYTQCEFSPRCRHCPVAAWPVGWRPSFSVRDLETLLTL